MNDLEEAESITALYRAGVISLQEAASRYLTILNNAQKRIETLEAQVEHLTRTFEDQGWMGMRVDGWRDRF